MVTNYKTATLAVLVHMMYNTHGYIYASNHSGYINF